MSTATLIAAEPPFCWVADCLVCELFSQPTTALAAGQAAAEHDDDAHHGEPTTTVHRA